MPNIIRSTIIRAIMKFLTEFQAAKLTLVGDPSSAQQLARCQRHIDELNAALAWVDAQ